MASAPAPGNRRHVTVPTNWAVMTIVRTVRAGSPMR